MPEPSKKQTRATETVTRTLLVAFLVSLVCSSFVASAAVLLKPRQVANALMDMRRNITVFFATRRLLLDVYAQLIFWGRPPPWNPPTLTHRCSPHATRRAMGRRRRPSQPSSRGWTPLS